MSNGITCSHGEDRCLTCHPLLDARGVEIEPGDTVIYGFGVSRSVAMAEGVVVGSPCQDDGCEGIYDDCSPKVSLTPSGLVRIRVVRRSYSSGSKPVVNLMPDRIVVLKGGEWAVDGVTQEMRAFLPRSPLPTQDQEARKRAQRMIDMYQGDIDATPLDDEAVAYARKRIAHYRKELRALDG